MKSQVIELVSPLGDDDEYTSGTRDMSAVASDFGIAVSNFVVVVDSDQDGTIEIDQSTDQIIWDEAQTPTDYVGNTGALLLSVQPVQRYVRAKFVNAATPQTRFTMTTGVDYNS